MKKNKLITINENQKDLFEGTVHAIKNEINFTEEQRSFINYDNNSSVILAACAGSGKTFSCVQRLKFLVNNGVDPNKIIFFSFTTAATQELRERISSIGIKVRDSKKKNYEGVTITTIHAFTNSILYKIDKGKKIADFFQFIEWYNKKYKPSSHATREVKEAFNETVSTLYEDNQRISSAIGAFKLQYADNIKCPIPDFLNEYSLYLRMTKQRDFSDILIEVRDLLRENKWIKMFRDKYDYIFIDEYQDTSTIQLQILLSLNAKYYYMIGDRNQSIYGYSGANCSKLENMLKKRRDVVEMSLSTNFRSDKLIVENSNKYSSLIATSSSKECGYISKNVILRVDDLVELMRQSSEIAILVRTNDVIKKLEKELLKRKVPMRYFNFINDNDIKAFKSKDISSYLREKLNCFKGCFDNDVELIAFIERFKNSNKFITTIHKSKGREFDECVVVNSVSPEILKECNIYDKLGKKRLEKISFTSKDEESKNIHYVAVSRSKHKLYFMIYE